MRMHMQMQSPSDRLPSNKWQSARSHFAPVTLLIAVVVAGCGGVHGIPISGAATQIAQTVCAKAYDCCTQSQLANNDSAGTTESECETKTTATFETNLENVQASVDMDRATYDGDKLQACLNTIRSSTCETLDMTNHFTGVPGCDSFVIPLVVSGGICSQSYECVDGWCQAPADMSGGDSTCQPHAQLGASCATASCEPGLACETNGSDKTCLTVGAIDAACAQGVECASGNCSIPSGASTGTCVAATGGQCFYTTVTGCAAAGGGRPGAGTVLLLAAFTLIAMRRARRSRAG